ncbi:hypothetical protein JOB18_023589 [Solea senegalensis]|uniref:Uncharacterized protein n=1 Tax=Solea senegalensis TaxID=28829 RepID=A0AAV6R5E8_SOLSE|nr:hypothetical protein JOB18_023589 [Solea senegalensis]
MEEDAGGLVGTQIFRSCIHTHTHTALGRTEGRSRQEPKREHQKKGRTYRTELRKERQAGIRQEKEVLCAVFT